MDINVEFERLQSAYLESRGDKDLYSLYQLIRRYMAGFLKNYATKTGCYITDLEGRIEDCTYFIIEQYLKKPNWKIDRFTAYYHNAIVKVLHGEELKRWDELKRSVVTREVTDNDLEVFTTDTERDLQIIKDCRSKGDQSEAVQCLRHKWKQGELFDEI